MRSPSSRDSVTGRFKDAAWQTIGEKLKSLLSQEEYDSDPSYTRNAEALLHVQRSRLETPEELRLGRDGSVVSRGQLRRSTQTDSVEGVVPNFLVKLSD